MSLRFQIDVQLPYLSHPQPTAEFKTGRILIDDISLSMFINICRGLFEKDKMLYAFMIAVGILRQAGEVRVSPSTAGGGKARRVTFVRASQAVTISSWLVKPMRQANIFA